MRSRFELPLTSPARTLLDIAPTVTDRQLELACDRGLVSRIVRPAQVIELLHRAGGHPGRGRLAAIVGADAGTSITRSEAEECVLELIRDAQLPRPQVNARLHGFEVDFRWPAQRLVLEVDGYRFHSTRRAFEHDRRKDSTLQTHGIATIRVTWRQLRSEPLAVVARIAQALAWLASRAAA
ncbi:MAG: endonuclease domain-containing protein [Steroidobacteraceae bacterium]